MKRYVRTGKRPISETLSELLALISDDLFALQANPGVALSTAIRVFGEARVFRREKRRALRQGHEASSAHFKATRGRLPVRALLFDRNADDFREQRLDNQTRVWVMRRYRGQRTALAANELLPVRLVKCDCSAQFLQQIKGGQESFVSALFRELIAMFFRQRSTDLAHARPKLPRTEPLGEARHKVIKQQPICLRKDLLGVGRKSIRRVRLSKTGPAPFTLNQTIAFETDQVRSYGIVCQFQGGSEFIDGARFDPQQSEDLTSRTIKHSLAPSLWFHLKSLVRRFSQNIY